MAYSTPQVVYDAAISAFEKSPAGRGVTFSESFGASGDQSRAVVAGLPADVVGFSLEPDMTRLVKAGMVARDWAQTPTRGLVSKSIVVFVVRKGNPKHIRTWLDLLKPGIQVVTPNPFTSGSAKWNLLAAYGAKGERGLPFLRELLTRHVKVQPKSGREALQTFGSGTGDVLLSYENEAIAGQSKGLPIDYVVPDSTVLIENPIAVTSTSKHPQQAKAFVAFVLSSAGQRIFAAKGYRPVDPAVFEQFASKFPTPRGLFTILELGGWPKVDKAFFDDKAGSVAKIEQTAGVSTAK